MNPWCYAPTRATHPTCYIASTWTLPVLAKWAAEEQCAAKCGGDSAERRKSLQNAEKQGALRARGCGVLEGQKASACRDQRRNARA
eukprot:1810003-Rhodomonas_salina.2